MSQDFKSHFVLFFKMIQDMLSISSEIEWNRQSLKGVEATYVSLVFNSLSPILTYALHAPTFLSLLFYNIQYRRVRIW
jgi:hypothetical protein